MMAMLEMVFNGGDGNGGGGDGDDSEEDHEEKELWERLKLEKPRFHVIC